MTIKELKMFLAWSDVDVVRIIAEKTTKKVSKITLIKEYKTKGKFGAFDQFLKDYTNHHLIVQDIYGVAFNRRLSSEENILTIYVY